MILWIYCCEAGRKLVNMYCGVVGLSGVVVCGEDIRYEYDIMVNIIIMSQHYGSLLWREDLWTVVSRGYQQSQTQIDISLQVGGPHLLVKLIWKDPRS